MRFNTRNPLGSVDDRDVQDNAANLDLAVNSLTLTASLNIVGIGVY